MPSRSVAIIVTNSKYDQVQDNINEDHPKALSNAAKIIELFTALNFEVIPLVNKTKAEFDAEIIKIKDFDSQ